MELIVAGALESKAVTGVVTGGLCAGVGRWIAEYWVEAVVVLITLLIIWWFKPDALRAVPLLRSIIPDDKTVERARSGKLPVEKTENEDKDKK